MYSSEKYEILYTEKQPSDARCITKDVAAQRTQVWRCGDMLEIRSFPIWSTRVQQAAAEQAVRTHRNRELVYQRHREKQRRDHFRRILEYNFGPKDLMITLTYDYRKFDYASVDKAEMEREMEQYPQDAEEARHDVQTYIRRVRYWMKRNGLDPKRLKYLYVTEEGREEREGEQLPWRQQYHHHVVLSGMDREAAEKIWADAHGFANSKRLQPNESGLAQMAAYLTKQKKVVNQHNYAMSRNLVIPEPEVSDRKISRRRVAKIAADVQQHGKEIFEQLYPGYYMAEQPKVVFSEFVSGAYIYARMCRYRSDTGREARQRGDTAWKRKRG